ncbi:MAG: Na+-transporting NADH:ubiquinone oxidoreductase, subunit NqrB [Cyanobacteria bacterium CRU_2_1]|nr:Na+-transporting NADH:ubiquinone oxidoreductase, subunit NqrB [Cyanobacteria bacterium RU_5_0]NJR60737.1 Na+-transporting NADH:ubiquinone oxidoreductase, subunit NqrB [Cyanobacteria bacterium CRU_2_1]
MLFKDARIYQILFLCLFLVLGIGTRDWTLHPGMIGVAIVTCLVVQWGMLLVISHGSWVNTKEHEPKDEGQKTNNTKQRTKDKGAFISLLSALITALGLSLLLRTDHYSTIALASALAILSKFLLRVQGKHIFNPANFGIIAALTLTHDAWVSPGQWGESSWYALLFLGTGGLVLKRVGRWDTTIAFLVAYAGLEAVRNVWLGWTWDVWLHRLMSGSLLLFALFMITDPRTIPNARIGRLIWAGAIAIFAFILRNYFFVPTAVFWALFALAPLSILLDILFPATRFGWVAPDYATDEVMNRGTDVTSTLGEQDAHPTITGFNA